MDEHGAIDLRATWGRIASGAAGGLAGGLVFGILMLTPAVVRPLDIGSTGVLPLVQQILGTSDPVVIWTLHALLSTTLGVVFALFASPHRYGIGALAGLAYGVVVFLGSQLVLRTLADQPVLAFDAAAAYSLVGHLLYGFFLGLTYVAFHREVIREALDAEDPRWREWGRRERKA